MDNVDKKNKWSKKQIIQIIVDDIRENGVLRGLIKQSLNLDSNGKDSKK